MQLRQVFRNLGVLLIILSLFMSLSALWACFRDEYEVVKAFGYAMGCGLFTGAVMVATGSAGLKSHMGRKEAMLIGGLSWFVGALLSALPFYFWGRLHEFAEGSDRAFRSFANCYFEAMSGLSTTGATILTNIPEIPEGLLFWRAFTQWLGGLGIVVLFVAVLPMLGVGTKRMFKVEATGPAADGVTPRIGDTARSLWTIYLILTSASILMLRFIGKMTWFDSITHTFTTVATGGFSTMNASAGAFSPTVQWILTFFMILAGINFGLYFFLFTQRKFQVFRDTELRFYIGIIVVSTAVLAFSLHGSTYPNSAGGMVEASGMNLIRDALFQTVSILTTAGFATANFEEWSHLSKSILVMLMFFGGCAGSTAGGIKVIRIVIALKVLWTELEKSFRPNVIRTIRFGKNSVDDQMRVQILAYVLAIVIIFVIGTGLLIIFEENPRLDEITAMTAIIATLNNIGPGFGAVGAVENFAWFNNSSKYLMTILMAVGRLEIFAVLVIFMPRFWKST